MSLSLSKSNSLTTVQRNGFSSGGKLASLLTPTFFIRKCHFHFLSVTVSLQRNGVFLVEYNSLFIQSFCIRKCHFHFLIVSPQCNCFSSGGKTGKVAHCKADMAYFQHWYWSDRRLVGNSCDTASSATLPHSHTYTPSLSPPQLHSVLPVTAATPTLILILILICAHTHTHTTQSRII